MLPYYDKYMESTPWVPGTFFPSFVHVAKDYIRIDEKVIYYKGIKLSQLEWIRQQWQDWAVNPCDKNNKEWAEAIIIELQDRLCEFNENAKLDVEVLSMEVPDYDLSSIFPAQCFIFRWRLSL
ncbi:MAG: hypothetical protein ACK40T_12295 [Akkermansiaceae bacterium]|jgi:hypothetical protein